MVRKSTASAPAPSSSAVTSSSASVAVTTSAVTTPVATSVAAAEAPAKKARKAAVKPVEIAASTATATSPAPASVAASSTSDASPAAIDTNAECLLRFVEFSAKLQTISSQISAIRTEFKLLEKQTVKELKKKVRGKNRKVSGNRQPSGFIKPTLITNELAEFLGKPHGIEMARTEVSKEINNYIKQYGLKDPANGRNINPDSKLSGLLKLGQEDKLTYFNLQKFMKHHFVKESIGSAVAASVSVSASV